jgi:IclR family acetate operon transcriptional repressor
MDVKTAGRTIEIFETFAREQEPLSLTDLARALGSPLSSCLYLVRTLERLGYLYGVGARRTLYPTRKLLDIASAIAMGEPSIERIEPILLKLRDESRETVILGKRQGNKVVYLSVSEGTETIRYAARAGDMKPMHSSAIGKALLSAMDEPSLAKLLNKLSLDRITPTTFVDQSALMEELKESAARGYAITRGENVPDVMAVARSLVLDKDIYGLAIAGPIYRLRDEVEVQLDRLQKACQEAASR